MLTVTDVKIFLGYSKTVASWALNIMVKTANVRPSGEWPDVTHMLVIISDFICGSSQSEHMM